MKKLILKIKILLTNISRITMSFLFINLNFFYTNRVFGVVRPEDFGEPTCYDVGPTTGDKIEMIFEDVLIILVPIAIVVGIIIIKRKKNKSKEEKEDDKKD